ncbi:MAG TPA: hypothetical protein VNZ54_03005 [bacterium]|nr:hypothetical protein [bacterium]
MKQGGILAYLAYWSFFFFLPSQGIADVSPLLPQAPKGSAYFVDGDRCSMLFGSNPTGWNTDQVFALLDQAQRDGERIVRIHLTNGMFPSGRAGALDMEWVGKWESIFDEAARRGLAVIPVFDVWAWWSVAGSGGTQNWGANPYNSKNGGPGGRPEALLEDGPTQRLFMAWLEALVRRWAPRKEILLWEPFSEINLLSGATEAGAVDFLRASAAVIRRADPLGRPVTIPLAGPQAWPAFFGSPALDLIEIRPYAENPPYNGNLDLEILDLVRSQLRFRKPVLIGESGLDSRPPSHAPAGDAWRRGLEQALWAEVVSGSTTGRMLWWEDGYDQYTSVNLRTSCAGLSLPMVAFVKGVDYRGFRPIELSDLSGIQGAALGSSSHFLLWVRDRRCEAPDWPLRDIQKASARLQVGGGHWVVDFYHTNDGKAFMRKQLFAGQDGLKMDLPPFSGSIAAKGYWLGAATAH